MAPIIRVKLRWTGFSGGPGLTVFHFRTPGVGAAWAPEVADANAAIGKVQAFANTIKGSVPGNTTLQVLGDVEVLEETSGDLVNVLGGTQPAALASTTSPTVNYSAASGAVITWRTAGIRNARRVKGRTFLVPLTGMAYQNDGTLDAGYITSFNTAAAALRAVDAFPVLGVFCRPSSSTATDGIFHQVTAHQVPDMAAILKSRRD